EYLADDDPAREWAKAAVRKHRFLPLYLGWVAALGIRADATLVRWDYEADSDAVRALEDPYWQRMALCQGAKKYPDLSALIPPRPESARDCDGACRGSGNIAIAPHLICQCGGLGWIVPGELPEPGPG